MRKLIGSMACFLGVAAAASTAWAHGFGLSLTYDTHGNPTAINASSNDPYLDQSHATGGASNLFLEEFSGTASVDPTYGSYYPVVHGFAQTAGAWPPYTASVDVVSPLYFSNGSGSSATLAAPGTFIDMFDLWAGNPQPGTNPHPGASFGDAFIYGNTPFVPGFGVSLYDAHELEKDLYFAAGPANGEYGFVLDITVHFTGGGTLTSGPLVDVFAISDPSAGGFASTASVATQDSATKLIYAAAMADVTFDGVVNGLDISLIAGNWLQSGTLGHLPGDANRDGVVNGLDIAAVASFWEAGSGGGGTGIAVPEPTTIGLGLLSVMWFFFGSRPLRRAARHR